MALIFPSLDEISKLKQQPTRGEKVLLNFLSQLKDEYYVYFQPYLNGSLPDVIIVHKTKGIFVIEVKDYQLQHYRVVDQNWYVSKNNSKVRSPLKQVKEYKDHIYSYVRGFVEESIIHSSKYGYVKTAVFFSESTEEEAVKFCKACGSHNKWIEILGNDSLTFDRFRKLPYFKKTIEEEFTSRYFDEFQLLFAPSMHLLELGKEIVYSKEQLKLIKSRKEKIKIKGVAGSGKTLVLAKRAVNAHKRTKGRVLILTYNITLRNFIRDKLNQVRDEFSWSMFHIDNYHNFISTMKNEYEVEREGYDDITMFEGVDVRTFDSIFIDEIQDYPLQWQQIIKTYFLSKNGEFVIFGDEKQNIYGNELKERDIQTVIENKEWEVLKESYRLSSIITDLSLNYFDSYLKNRYQQLQFAIQQEFSFNSGHIGNVGSDGFHTLEEYCEFIYDYIHFKKIPYNDVIILSRHNASLREMEYIFRTKYALNITRTFEKKETHERLVELYGEDSWQYDEKVSKVRRSERLAFQMNRGTMKMSTIYSFKGWEGENIFLLLANSKAIEEEAKDDELIYTGITRSKNRLYFLNQDQTKYRHFLDENKEMVETINIYDYILPV